jgi:hypothetical protein
MRRERRSTLLARIDDLSRALAELRAEIARELGLDGDDEIARLAVEDLRRAARRGGRP